jgi:hypothetical protein
MYGWVGGGGWRGILGQRVDFVKTKIQAAMMTGGRDEQGKGTSCTVKKAF